jgi:hypothetical protein
MQTPHRPSIAEKIRIIETVEKKFLTLSTDQIIDLINPVFTYYVAHTFILALNLILYRGIKYSQKPLLLKDLSYAPIKYAKINRASEEGEQMFYCTTKKKAVLYELNAMPGDRLVISSWYTIARLNVNSVGYTNSNLKELSSSSADLTWDNVDPNVKFYDEENLYIANYLAKTFSQRINSSNLDVYRLTIPIAKKHFPEDQFHGLIYPTIQFNANAENLAIKPVAIDNNFIEFERVEYIEVIELVENKYKYKILDVSDSILNDKIVWKNLKQTLTVTDDNDELYFIEDEGEIIAYNEKGDVIPYDESS